MSRRSRDAQVAGADCVYMAKIFKGVVTGTFPRPGVGSIPFPGGATFRVRAPDATGVAVSLAQPRQAPGRRACR
jgi:hypothetical protein